MRKPRDYNAELRALDDKAKLIKERRLHQLGELVAATGADALPVEQLAGVLLAAVESNDSAAKEGWRKRGAAFFQGSRTARGGARGNAAPSGRRYLHLQQCCSRGARPTQTGPSHDRDPRPHPPPEDRARTHRPQPLDDVPQDAERHLPAEHSDQHTLRRLARVND